MQTALRNKRYRRPLVGGLPDPLDVTFRCANHIDSKSCPDNGVYISLAVAEKRFLEWLDHEAQMDEETSEKVSARMAKLKSQSSESDELRNKIEAVEAQLSGVRAREDKLTDAVLNELIPEESARRKRAEIEAQKRSLLREHTDLQGRIKKVPKAVPRPDRDRLLTARKIYEKANQTDRRELVSRLVREIRVYKGKDMPNKIEVYPLWVAPPPELAPAGAA